MLAQQGVVAVLVVFAVVERTDQRLVVGNIIGGAEADDGELIVADQRRAGEHRAGGDAHQNDPAESDGGDVTQGRLILTASASSCHVGFVQERVDSEPSFVV